MSGCSDATQAGFLNFIRNFMAIPASRLPDDSPYILWSFTLALDTVNKWLMAVPNADKTGVVPSIYAQAVYNWAADMLIQSAQDPADADPVPGTGDPGRTYFENLRYKWSINSFTPGVIQSTSDEGTSESLLVPEWMQQLQMSDLQQLKTPWGRAYLALAQKYGPSVVGIS